MKISTSIIKYIDLFGTRCTFYSEKVPKYYSVVGGFLTFISIAVCIGIFIMFSLDDIKRKFPITSISSIPSQGYKNIKFGREKIWIPWRISDYNNNEFINHTGLLYPIIYYYSGIKKNNTKDYNLTRKKLNYKLCNETSMVNRSNIYYISIPLNELFCIDMEDLDMGGSWMTEFINYIEFDLYFCEEGINYDEDNSKCSSFNKIRNFIGNNNSLEISVYYPIVQFQPTNETYPVIVIYKNFFYHISKYVSKIDRIFLQEYTLSDDKGWLLKKEYNSSYWGLNSISGDTYYTGDKEDLMNEGSNSRTYSFNIYLEPGVIQYTRYYKKIFTIFSDFFPVAYIIFVIMKNISKIFKKAEFNKKLIELLFENLKEKQNVFEKKIENIYNNEKFNLNKYFNKKNNYNKKKESIRSSYNNNGIKIKIFTQELNKEHHRYSIESPLRKKDIASANVKHSSFVVNKNSLNIDTSIVKKLSYTKKGLSKIKNRNMQNMSNMSNMPFILNNTKSFQNLLTLENNYTNAYRGSKISNMSKILENTNNNKNNNINLNKNKNKNIIKRKTFVIEKLFPYKYYFFSAFLKSLNYTKDHYLFSSRFTKIFTFLGQLIDIETYLCLQREFNAVKRIFSDNNRNLIEENKKININSKNFINDISDCIGGHKFYILAQGMNKE
jgi:hypothetical protein